MYIYIYYIYILYIFVCKYYNIYFHRTHILSLLLNHGELQLKWDKTSFKSHGESPSNFV